MLYSVRGREPFILLNLESTRGRNPLWLCPGVGEGEGDIRVSPAYSCSVRVLILGRPGSRFSPGPGLGEGWSFVSWEGGGKSKTLRMTREPCFVRRELEWDSTSWSGYGALDQDCVFLISPRIFSSSSMYEPGKGL